MEPQKLYRNFHEIMEDQAEWFGTKNCIESVDQNRCISFAEMNAYCNQIANFLKDKGLTSQDVVTVVGGNTIETLIVFFGVLKYGAIINPLNSEESSFNIQRLIDRVRPKLVILDRELSFDRSEISAPVFFLSSANHHSMEPDDFFEQIGRSDKLFSNPVGRPADIGEILFSSGTTEIPKGILWSRESMLLMVEELVERLGISSQDRLLEYRAYSWASAQLLSVLSTMLTGATLVFARRFSRTRFPLWLKDYRVTKSSGVPAVFNILVSNPVALHQREVPHLQFITSSSAPLSVDILDRFEHLYGIPINQMAGMSEAGWLMANPPHMRKKGSVGPPLKHKQVRIVGESGDECSVGEVGEIVVSGRSIGEGYLPDNGAIESFPKGGFHTGDIGYADPDGYIFITGRKKDLIIRGGVNISPMEIDTRLLQHPLVREAATIGTVDSTYGEEVISFVVLPPEERLTEEDLRAFCRETLPEFKIPKRIFFISTMPTTPTGKIAKPRLVQMLEQQGTGTEVSGLTLGSGT